MQSLSYVILIALEMQKQQNVVVVNEMKYAKVIYVDRG